MAKKDKLGITVKKEDNFSEWYTQICGETGAQLVELRYGIQGFTVVRPWAYQIIKKIYEHLEREFEKDNHDPVQFPVVIPEASLKKEEEHAGFTPEVFWLTKAGNQKLEEPLALRPTGETAFYPMYSLWIRTYKDLPLKLYQSRHNSYRNEMTTRPFLRGREFCFMESHNCYATHKEVEEQIKKDMEISKEVIQKICKIPFIFFKRPEWDKFLGADATYTSDTLMPDGRRNQLSSTHDLGHRFAKPYEVKFVDKDEKEKYVFQTCYGPGIFRILSAIIGIHGDNNGLILPSQVTPRHLVIIPIITKDEKNNKKVMNEAKKIKEKIENKGYRVVIDDSEKSPGFKYNHWEMLGVPLRLELGPRELEEKKATLAYRTKKDKTSFLLKNLEKEVEKGLKEVDEDIKKNAEKYFKGNTKTAENLKDIKKIIEEHRGFVKTNFCSVDQEGEECADKLKAETNGGYVCGENFDRPEKPKKGSKCACCNKEANSVVYIAKSI